VKSVTCNLPDSLYKALGERMETDNANCDHVVSMALSKYLRKPIHTLFQVSTSAALVEGLYQGAVQVSRLLGHGDFGLGMFIDLDGEMVVLDGVCYQVSSTSAVAKVEGDRLIPYPVVTGFKAGFSKQINPLDSYSKLGFCLR
jgi:acetolactate decarboxylase